MFCLRAVALSLLVATTPLVAQIVGSPERFTNEDEVSDLLKKYVESRVDRPFFWKPCLNIGGDVRFEYNHYHTNRQYYHENDHAGFDVVAGSLTDNPYFVNGNIYFEFDTSRTWAKLQIEAVNPGGTFPSQVDRVRVKRAIMGYNFWKDSCSRAYMELGRQRLGEHFESQVQYGSRLDGVFGRVSKCLPRLGEAYAQAGYMVVETRSDQYAYLGEIGAMNVADQSVYVKLSFVDWTNGGRFNYAEKVNQIKEAVTSSLEAEAANELTGGDPNKLTKTDKAALAPQIQEKINEELKRRKDLGYRVAQIVIGKKVPCFWFGKKLKAYVGLLYNVDPTERPVAVRNNDGTWSKGEESGYRFAGYAGFQLGEVSCCGDWAVKACYQYVQPFSILPSDNSGIGRTNAGDDAFLTANFGTTVLVTNYKGIDAEIGYAVTDHVTARLQYQHANHVSKRFGGPSTFDRVMVRFIYAF